ncbi:PocR ligand-binding domain-containing protein [Sulfurimonas marina]|uniref:diguanylate cyclase n=1 Tax=Sulfurimonas marina TaxID=2590551 RepID=A0A7M1AWI2_9BACT|nr:PocR ligand-binding domain-containing protein [Sulfurimonas marina]QOP40742.1 diguanylate cyclase [Sulfurimonas marina]
MNYKFSEIVDITVMQELLDSFAPLYPVATAILDVDGKILAASSWRRICTVYHRVNPATSQRCLESDTALANGLKEQKEYNVYKCKNGLVDVAFPIIIDGQHLANFFIGQFLFEEPDREYFINQAKTFGFDTEDYLQALDEVKVFSEDEIKNLLKFFTKEVNILALLGKAYFDAHEANYKLEQKVKERTSTLEKTNRLLQKSQEIANLGIWELDIVNNKLNWSDEIYKIFEIDKEKFNASYEAFLQTIHPDDRDMVSKAYENSLITKNKYQITHRLLMNDGRIKWVEEQCETEFDSQGNALKSIGTVYDISRIKQIEKKLQRTINKQEALLKVQNVGFAFLKNRKFTWMNSVLENMLGYESGELIGKESRVVYPSEEYYLSIGKQGYPELADKGVYTQEVDLVKKDATHITFLVSMTALKKDLSEVVVVLVDVTETTKLRKQLEKVNKQLAEQANKDFLTRLYNRRGFEEHCKEIIELAKRDGSKISIAMFDIDHFKKVNDTYGHDEGDKVLKFVAEILVDVGRKSDIIGRHGGEEFILLMPPKTDKEEAIIAAERIRLSIQNSSIEKINKITISAGVATITPQPNDNTEKIADILRNQADEALYFAKEHGRNKVVHFDNL